MLVELVQTAHTSTHTADNNLLSPARNVLLTCKSSNHLKMSKQAFKCWHVTAVDDYRCTKQPCLAGVSVLLLKPLRCIIVYVYIYRL